MSSLISVALRRQQTGLCVCTDHVIPGMRLKFVQQLQDQTIKEGNTAFFELELTHEDVPVVWYRNEVKLHVSRTVVTHVEGRRHFLEMRTVSLDDTCQIKAEVKGVYSMAKLTVIGNDTLCSCLTSANYMSHVQGTQGSLMMEHQVDHSDPED